MTAPSQNSGDKTAEVVRSMLDHESDVINHRMSWLGQFQGFLFAGLAFAWNLHENTPIFIICILGAISSAVVLLALISASQATRRLLLWWQKNRPSSYHGPDVMGFEIKATKPWHYLLASWNLMPISFLAAWITLLVVRLIYYFPKKP